VMLTDFATLQAGETLADAVRLTLRGSQRDFPILDRGRVVGVLTGTDLLAALEDHGEDYPVTLAMRSESPVAEPAEMLEPVFQRLREWGSNTIPVVQTGRLVGLVTMDSLGEYLLIEAALQKRGQVGRHDG
jgi:CBS domain-containing protein